MAQITVLNPKFIDRGDGLPGNWVVGGFSWSCDDISPQSSAVGGCYQGGGADNSLFQNNIGTLSGGALALM